MPYTTVIFDMDGTVLNTLDDLTDAVNAMRRREGLTELPLSHVRKSVGSGVAVLMERTLPGGRAYPRFREATAFYRSYYESHSLIKTSPYPGILSLMEALRRRGVTMAVVSNKQDAAVQELSRHFFGDYMAVSLGEREGLRRKPSPDMVNAALSRLGRRREECLFVGDSDIDCATAGNAEVDCAAVTWGFRDRALLETLAPKYIIDSPEELLTLVPGR
ncbi:MAG: HAD-IA family hydrolase [Clostridiales bacterium]|nr:HAD-IA family hydrolase [Clostridiales bacterium]